MKELLYYDNLSEFKNTYHQKLLTAANLSDEEKYFRTLTSVDGEDFDFNKFCYVLEKDGKKYLLESKYKNDLPLLVVHSEKFAHRNDALYLIRKHASAKFVPARKMSFKNFINVLSSFEHSNKDHQLLMWIISVGQLMDRINYRASTPPGFGKDGIIDICGHLFGKAATIENATRAKLEYMTVLKLLAVNEVVDISGEKWRDTEQFLLQVGAMKPTVTKSSRSTSGVGEMLDISNLSITLMYNDIDRYPANKKYFDQVASDQLKDRFLPLRFWGVLQEDFNRLGNNNPKEFINANKNSYEDLIRTFVYYEENYSRELKKYNADKHLQRMKGFRSRWKINIGRIMKFVDLYSDTQEEFDRLVSCLFDCIDDYSTMGEMSGLLEQLHNKGKVVGQESYEKVMNSLRLKNSFVEKKKVINNFLLEGGKVGNDSSAWDWR